jgi:hypothetical protein
MRRCHLPFCGLGFAAGRRALAGSVDGCRPWRAVEDWQRQMLATSSQYVLLFI